MGWDAGRGGKRRGGGEISDFGVHLQGKPAWLCLSKVQAS